jgi:hypothetical protein
MYRHHGLYGRLRERSGSGDGADRPAKSATNSCHCDGGRRNLGSSGGTLYKDRKWTKSLNVLRNTSEVSLKEIHEPAYLYRVGISHNM